jgi:hypothetical protein
MSPKYFLHFKGLLPNEDLKDYLYEIIFDTALNANGEMREQVVYQSGLKKYVWVRDKEEFFGTIDTSKHFGSNYTENFNIPKEIPRFIPISEDIYNWLLTNKKPMSFTDLSTNDCTFDFQDLIKTV